MSYSAPAQAVWDAVSLTITDPAAVAAQLDSAVSTLLPTALDRKCGILVLQNGPGRYTASVSEEVPFGLTRERTTWDRNTAHRGDSILPGPLDTSGLLADTRTWASTR